MYVCFAAYSHPYVISFSERAVDVFDSSTAEWLQTIPLKKVRFNYRSKVAFERFTFKKSFFVDCLIVLIAKKNGKAS